MGIKELCFTDHVDYGIKRDWVDPRGVLYRKGGKGEPKFISLANVDYPKYVDKIQHLQEQYKNQITIKLGMEFGMQKHTISQYEDLFARFPFDFIILSIHEIENKEFWTGDFQRGLSRSEYNLMYYMEMLTLVENYHNYSVLGHMDLISRYDKEGDFSFDEIRPLVQKILELYRDLGGRIITIDFKKIPR